MQKAIKSESLEVYMPHYNTVPRVYYQNLYRYTKCFIAGSVAFKDSDECAEGATVTLSKGSKKATAEVLTNNYGDFKIDDLEKESGFYRLVIAYPDYQNKELNVELTTSINLGTIFL